MSRMTGRYIPLKSDYEHNSSTNLDVSRSIEYLKPKTRTNYNFNNQITREKANSKSIKMPNHDYTYNYEAIKPSKKSAVEFDKTIGRYYKKRKQIEAEYSYTHYDYNHYV